MFDVRHLGLPVRRFVLTGADGVPVQFYAGRAGFDRLLAERAQRRSRGVPSDRNAASRHSETSVLPSSDFM